MEQLRYTDEHDRALGIAGVAIAMLAWDAQHLLTALSLDNETGRGVEVTPDFHFAGNPRFSARLAWQQMVKQTELSSAMIIGNTMCRWYVGRQRRLTSAINATLRALVRDEAHAICSLDDDETDRIYTRTTEYLDRLFTHNTVATVAAHLADTLLTRRRLTASEALDELSALSRL